jgi:hypothetical protein
VSDEQPPFEVGETVYLEETKGQPWVIAKPCERREWPRTGEKWWAVFIGKSVGDDRYFVSDDKGISRTWKD